MLIDTILPQFDFNEVHQTRIRAEPARVFQAIREVTTAELPVFHILMTIRMIPAILGRRLTKPLVPEGPLLGWTDEIGALMVSQPGEEMVFGMAGQFWKPNGALMADIKNVQEFTAFNTPGYVRAAVNFFLSAANPEDGATHLRTETRVQAVDADARRKFGRYWALIYPGSSLIRFEWLRAIRARAEQSRRS